MRRENRKQMENRRPVEVVRSCAVFSAYEQSETGSKGGSIDSLYWQLDSRQVRMMGQGRSDISYESSSEIRGRGIALTG